MITALILAGGKGTRMEEKFPKSLKKIGGKEIIFWTLEKLSKAGKAKIVVVSGYKGEELEKAIKAKGYKVLFARQRKFLGTAYATKIGFLKSPKKNKTILILFGDDSALYSVPTLIKFLRAGVTKKRPLVLMVIKRKRATSIGGIKVDEEGRACGTMTKDEIVSRGLKNYLTLCGAFLVERDWLSEKIHRIKKNPKSGEYSLPKIIEMAADEGKHARLFELKDDLEWNSVNTTAELEEAERKFKRRKK